MDETLDLAEPHIVLCVDGNFQHKRHLAAIHEIPGHKPPATELFLDPAQVDQMAETVAGRCRRDPQSDELVVCAFYFNL